MQSLRLQISSLLRPQLSFLSSDGVDGQWSRSLRTNHFPPVRPAHPHIRILTSSILLNESKETNRDGSVLLFSSRFHLPAHSTPAHRTTKMLPFCRELLWPSSARVALFKSLWPLDLLLCTTGWHSPDNTLIDGCLRLLCSVSLSSGGSR